MHNGRNPVNFSFILTASAVVVVFAAVAYYFYAPKKVTAPEKKEIDSNESTPPATQPPSSKSTEFDNCELNAAPENAETLHAVDHEEMATAEEDDQRIAGRFNPANNNADPEWDAAPESDDRFYNDLQSAVAAAAAKKNQGFLAGLAAYNPFATAPTQSTATSATTLKPLRK